MKLYTTLLFTTPYYPIEHTNAKHITFVVIVYTITAIISTHIRSIHVQSTSNYLILSFNTPLYVYMYIHSYRLIVVSTDVHALTRYILAHSYQLVPSPLPTSFANIACSPCTVLVNTYMYNSYRPIICTIIVH